MGARFFLVLISSWPIDQGNPPGHSSPRMSIATSPQAQDPRASRGLVLTLLRALFALCIMTFMVGGPANSSLQTSTSELSRQDSISVGEADASPWFRRTNSSTEFVGVPYGLTYDD